MKAEFDSYAHNYTENLDVHLSATGETSTFWSTYKAQKLKIWLPNYLQHPPKNILDFGCGTGFMTNEMRTLFPYSQLYGVDPSQESIEIAQKQYPSIRFKASEENLSNFSDNTFDLIYCSSVFHHIPFDRHNFYIQELKRILSQTGILVIFELNPLNPGTTYVFNRNPIDKNAKMLTPWYATKLAAPIGKTSCLFYGFFR